MVRGVGGTVGHVHEERLVGRHRVLSLDPRDGLIDLLLVMWYPSSGVARGSVGVVPSNRVGSHWLVSPATNPQNFLEPVAGGPAIEGA